MSTVFAVASNTIFQILGKIITMSVTILAYALVRRTYGLEEFGAFSFIVGFPTLFYTVADFGLNAIATRRLAVNAEEMDKYLSSIIVLRTGLSLALITIVSISMLFFPYPNYIKAGIMIGLLTIFTTSLHMTSNIGFQVKLRYDLSNIASSLASLVNLAFIYLMVMTKASVVFASVSYVLAGFVVVILSFYFLSRINIRPTFRVDFGLMKDLMWVAFPLGLMFIFSQLNFKSDSILLSFLKLPERYHFNNLQTLGVYGLPYKIFEVALIVPTFFMNSLYPVMVRHHSENLTKLLSTFKRSAVLLLGLGVLCGIGGVLFSGFAISVFGATEGYNESVLVLKILLGTVFLFYLTQPFAWLIVTLNGQKYLPVIYLLAAVINIGLNLIFIPLFSFYASVHITWITEFFVLVLLVFTAQHLIKRA